jgi:hypothetical protein
MTIDERKGLLALLHEVRASPLTDPNLPQSIRRARACDRLVVMLHHLEAEHEEAKGPAPAVSGLRDIHGIGDHGSTIGVCPDPFCCSCECSGCKRTWWAAGRPTSKDCPHHKH